MKIIVFTVVLIFCFVFISPDSAIAGTHVSATLYISGVFVVGGVTVFISILLGSERHSSKKDKKQDDKNDSSSDMYALNFKSMPVVEEYIGQAGMVKLLEW